MDRNRDTPWVQYLCGVCTCLFITGGLIWLIVLTVEFNHLHHTLEETGVIGDQLVEAAAGAAGAAGASLAAAGAAAAAAKQAAPKPVQLSRAGAVKANSNAFNYLSAAKSAGSGKAKAADPVARWARTKKQK